MDEGDTLSTVSPVLCFYRDMVAPRDLVVIEGFLHIRSDRSELSGKIQMGWALPVHK